MPHARKLIRDAVAALLTGLPTTQNRVEIGRTRPLGANHQPTLLIYTPEEIGGEPLEGNPASVGRSLQLVIDARVVTEKPPDDDLDAIALEVEQRMRSDETLSGLVFNVTYVRTTMDAKAEGEMHAGAARIEYSVSFWDPDEDEED